MKRYISFSGGKDSTATVILCHELGINVDEIIFSEVIFDKARGISGENPEHIKFIKEVAIPKFEEWGYKTKIVQSEKDYYYYYYFKHCTDRSKYKGKIMGFPLGGLCWVNDRLKVRPLKIYKKANFNNECEELIGIAVDEPERLERIIYPKRSILAEQNFTEQMAYELCKKYGLLSPIYETKARGGCWFCPNCSIKEYKELRDKHPELWAELKILDDVKNKTSEYFKYGLTLSQVEEKMNDIDRQMTIFDYL